MALKPTSELWKYFTNIVHEGMAECKLCMQRLRNNRSYNLRLHLRKVHNNRNEVNKYFEVHVQQNISICKTCNKRLQNRLCNLRLHMRRSHGIEISLPEDNPPERVPSPQPYDEDQIQAVLKVAKRKMQEQVGNEEKRPNRWLHIKMDRNTIIRGVIGLIVEDGVSPELFRSKHFKAVLQPMCEAISRKKERELKVDVAEIERIISLMTNYTRNIFSNELHWRLLSIKIDTDLDALPNTFCVSVQFINDGKIQNRVLGIIDLKDDEQLKEEHIKQILYKYNIDSNQIISAFWDNTKKRYNSPVRNSEYLKNIKQIESYPDIYLGDVKIERYIGASAQLCLLDIFKNSNILQPFLECRNLVKFISNKSNSYYEYFVQNNLTIPHLDSPWKWGSTYKMMMDLNAAQEFFKNIKFEKLDNSEDQFNCNDELWAFIEAFCKSLSFLQKSILKYHHEELHIGDFYAQWLKCKLLSEKLLATNNKENVILTLILKEVLQSIDKRTQLLLSEDRIAACLYMDPRFQRILNTAQKTSAAEYLKKLWCRAKLYIFDDSEPMDVSAQLLDDDEDAFLNEFLSHDIQTNNKGSNDVYQKIEALKLAFQMVDTNILSFWKSQKSSEPEMHSLSSICFAIPATEIYNKKRYSDVYRLEVDSKLSTFTKENLLNMRLKFHLLDDALEHLQLFNDDQSNPSSTLSETEDECNEISEDDNSNTASTITEYSSIAETSTSDKVQPSGSGVSAKHLPEEEFI